MSYSDDFPIYPEEYTIYEEGGVEVVVIYGEGSDVTTNPSLDYGSNGFEEWVNSGRSVTIDAYDINGNEVASMSGPTCTWDSCEEICEVDIEQGYVEGGGGGWDEIDDSGSFPGDKLLLLRRVRSPPENWPDALETDSDFEFNVTDDIDGMFCPGSTIRMSAEIENKQLMGDVSGTLSITNELTGNTDTERITVSERRAHSISVRESVPNDVSGDGMDVLTISFDGETVYEGSADVGVSDSDISITDIDYPNESFSGEEERVTVDLENTGDCNVTAEAHMNGEQLASRSLRSGSSTSLRLDIEMQDVDETRDIEYSLPILADGQEVSTAEFTIETSPTNITIGDVDSPDTVFQNEEFEIEIEADNDTSQSLSGEVTLERGDGDSETESISSVRGGSSTSVTFTQSTEQADDLSYEVIIESEGVVSDTTTFSVAVRELELQVSDADVPNGVCRGEEFTASFTVNNPADVEADGELTIESQEVGDVSRDVEGITASRPETFDIDYTAPTDADIDTITYDATAYKPATGRSDSVTVSSDIEDAGISITEVSAPQQTDELEVDVSVTVENDGVCGTDVDVQISEYSEEVYIGSGKTVTVDTSKELSTDEMDVDISVTNLVTGEVVATDSHSIMPVNYAELNLDEGYLEFRNGYGTNISIEGQIVANDIEFEGNVESEFELAGGRTGDVFDGEISGDANVVTRIDFDDLQFINVGTGDSFAWIVDDELKERSSSFRYGTRAIFQLVPDDVISPERAELVVIAGPAGNLGAIRSRLGLDIKLLNKSMVTVDTSDFRM